MKTTFSWVTLAFCLTSGGGVPAVAAEPEMFGCGVYARSAVMKRDGSLVWQDAPDEMARLYEHCDFVALGRFSTITITEYDTKALYAVVALFEPEEVLLGPQLAGVRVRIPASMLVEPGEDVSRDVAEAVDLDHGYERVLLHDSILQDLGILRRGDVHGRDRLLEALEEKTGRVLHPPQREPIDRRTAMKLGTGASAGTTFYQEGGAIRPDRTFLLGLDAQPEGGGAGRLNAIYALIHWGAYADEVARAIRVRRSRAAR